MRASRTAVLQEKLSSVVRDENLQVCARAVMVAARLVVYSHIVLLEGDQTIVGRWRSCLQG